MNTEGTEIVVNVYVALVGAARRGASATVADITTLLPFTAFQVRQAVQLLDAHGLVMQPAPGSYSAVLLHIEMAEAPPPGPLQRLAGYLRARRVTRVQTT